jgi:hypothetical protein
MRPLCEHQKFSIEHEHHMTHEDSCVRTPPMIIPNAPPTGAPAANVAKAIERILEGGNACARIPS